MIYWSEGPPHVYLIMNSFSYNLEASDQNVGHHSTWWVLRLFVSRRRMELQEQQQLVEDAKTNGDSFGKLYDYYFPKVYAFVASRISNRDDAEDIVSDIFMKVLEHLPKFEWRGVPFAAWLFRIARNTLNDYYVHHNKTKTTDIDEVFDLSEDENKTSPHKKAEQEELGHKVKELMRTLPEREVTVLQLKFFSQLNNREIMHVTGLSESNVAIIIYRSLRKLKPDLKYFA